VTRFPAREAERLTLRIDAATDLDVMAPLIRDFQELRRDVSVEYHDRQTIDLFALAADACRAGRPLGDLAISSAVDELVKLANDGCAVPYHSPVIDRLPAWARWRDEVVGFTSEPAVIAYNRDLVPAGDVPHTRTELVELLRRAPDTYAGKVGSYDVEKSAVGYLLASSDAENAATIFGRLLEAFGRVGLVQRPRSADLLDDLAAGRTRLAYNVLGSYAYRRMRAGQPIGLVLPHDYVLVFSRGVLIPPGAAHADESGRFVDYLLSERARRVAAEIAFLSLDDPLPPGVDGPPSLATSGVLQPIAIGPPLLATQDQARRARFLATWRAAIGG
jgi:iron(III) transport system substrate-binding protein